MSDAYRELTPKDFETIGRITVAATLVEEELYGLAEDLDMAEPRERQARDVADAIRAKIRADGLPPWATVTPEEVLTTVSAAKGTLTLRGQVIHSIYPKVFMGDDVQVHTLPTSGKEPLKAFDPAKRDTLLRDLRAARRNLRAVHIGVLPMLFDHVYGHYYGPGRPPVMLATGPNQFPPKPTPEELADGWARFLDQYGLAPVAEPPTDGPPEAS